MTILFGLLTFTSGFLLGAVAMACFSGPRAVTTRARAGNEGGSTSRRRDLGYLRVDYLRHDLLKH
jgi:hypothetical protein